MPRITVPTEGAAVCACCRKPRGNTRKGWTPVLKGAEVVGYTCGDCPRDGEPIKRIEGRNGAAPRWRVTVDSTPPGAVQRKQATRTLPDLTAARAFVAEVRAEVAAAGAYHSTAPETVSALAERWLASRCDVREVTREGYANWMRPALRRIGQRAAADVTVADIEALSEWLLREGGKRGQPLGAGSVRSAMVALGQVFDMAEREGAVPRNVVRMARRPRRRKVVGRDLEHWRPADLLRFRDTADADPLAGAWRLTLCGLTRADVMGLRWSDVDLDAGTVTVRQGRITLDHGHAVDEPKSAQRRRTVPVEALHAGTVPLLRAMRARQAADRLAAGGAWQDSGLVVVDALGTPLRPEVYSDRFRRLCATAKVPAINLHSVRHSLAFWLHALGVTPADGAALLGHTVEVHLSTYLPESGATGIAAAAVALGRATAGAAR